MDEKRKFDLLIKNQKEEEKDYYFLDDPDEEKITFTNHRRGMEGEYDLFGDLEEDCSDCDKDCKSKILADLPTNDSNSILFEHVEEEAEATKFLTRLGLLERIEDNEIFAIDEPESSLHIRPHDDFELYSPRWNLLLAQNDDQNEESLLVPFHSLDERLNNLSSQEKELIEEGLPILQIDEEYETFPEPDDNSRIVLQEGTTMSECGENTRKNGETEDNNDTTPDSNRKRKKTTEFNNVLERKAFRMMRKYYKSTFEKFATPFNYKKNVKTMSPEEMDQLLCNYVKIEFDFLVSLLTGNELIQMITCLKRIILSDRYNKRERVTYGLDFTTTRNLFNKYSTNALYDFIGIPTNSILFVHFFMKQGRTLCRSQNDVDKQKLEKQMGCLIKVSFEYLPAKFVEVYCQPSCQLINFLN